jgi:hypothetical protein
MPFFAVALQGKRLVADASHGLWKTSTFIGVLREGITIGEGTSWPSGGLRGKHRNAHMLSARCS